MGSQDEEKLSPPISWRKAAMKHMERGRDSVAKLASLLQMGSSESSWPEKVTAGLLIEVIASSFDKGMAALEQLECPSSCVAGDKEGVGGKGKMQSTRKAGYRRRGSPYSWARITSSTIDDGHAWRKYGQKDIFSAKYPRSYFRCTHKFDQGCKASKQVQRSEDDPSLFVITYFGEHTCVDPKNAMIPPSTDLSADSASEHFVSPKVEFKVSAQEQETVTGLGQEYNGLPSALYPPFMSYGMELMDYEDFLNFDHTDLFQD